MCCCHFIVGTAVFSWHWVEWVAFRGGCWSTADLCDTVIFELELPFSVETGLEWSVLSCFSSKIVEEQLICVFISFLSWNWRFQLKVVGNWVHFSYFSSKLFIISWFCVLLSFLSWNWRFQLKVVGNEFFSAAFRGRLLESSWFVCSCHFWVGSCCFQLNVGWNGFISATSLKLLIISWFVWCCHFWVATAVFSWELGSFQLLFVQDCWSTVDLCDVVYFELEVLFLVESGGNWVLSAAFRESCWWSADCVHFIFELELPFSAESGWNGVLSSYFSWKIADLCIVVIFELELTFFSWNWAGMEWYQLLFMQSC
jgi:hypothetical protein